MNHTPGPWTASGVIPALDSYEVLAMDGAVSVCDFVTKADAHLIAAAPDLLAALKVMINHYADVGSEHWNMADRAISKAESTN